jgi:hypothetical protein
MSDDASLKYMIENDTQILNRGLPPAGPRRMRQPGAHHPVPLRHVDRRAPVEHPLMVLIIDHLRLAHRDP